MCGRLRKCKPFSEALLLRSVCSSGSPRQRSGSPAPRLFPWNEGQPSGWPARTSRTVGRGCHPQGRNGVEEPRSGLTAAGDRARGRRFRAKRGPLGTSEAVHRRFRKLHFVGWFGACGQVLSCVRPHCLRHITRRGPVWRYAGRVHNRANVLEGTGAVTGFLDPVSLTVCPYHLPTCSHSRRRRPHASPHYAGRQITPKTSRYARCSSSMFPNVSINGRIRSSGQLGRW